MVHLKVARRVDSKSAYEKGKKCRVKKKQQTSNEVSCAEPHQVLLPNLITSSASPRNGILNESGIFWSALVR